MPPLNSPFAVAYSMCQSSDSHFNPSVLCSRTIDSICDSRTHARWHSSPTVVVQLAADAPGSPGGGHHLTVRNRGTEYIKSPEMLMVANAHKKGRDTYDRRKREGAGAASDVWSMGCLLAEVVLGDWLFYDPDWIRFFIRLTRSGEVRALAYPTTAQPAACSLPKPS